jgi:hypothetical protein
VQYAVFRLGSEGRPELVPDWQAKVEAIANVTIRHVDKIAGIRISENLVCSGLPYENLTAV